MTASPQTRNYLYGKGELFFRAVGSEGYDHLGNAPAFTISLTEEKLEHFSSMSGTKTKDLQLVTQKGATVAFTLEEFTTGNILRAFKGAAVAKQMQAAATVSGQSVSANKGLYTFVGKEKLGFTRLEHGTVFLTADCESSDEQLVDALTASDVTGELLFVGQPDQGPGLVVQCWKVTLSLSGEVGLISEELASIPMTGEVLADDLNHPESPFFRVRYLG